MINWLSFDMLYFVFLCAASLWAIYTCALYSLHYYTRGHSSSIFLVVCGIILLLITITIGIDTGFNKASTYTKTEVETSSKTYKLKKFDSKNTFYKETNDTYTIKLTSDTEYKNALKNIKKNSISAQNAKEQLLTIPKNIVKTKNNTTTITNVLVVENVIYLKSPKNLFGGKSTEKPHYTNETYYKLYTDKQ